MGSESIAYEAESQMGYWLRGHEAKKVEFNTFLLQKHYKRGQPFLLL